MSGFVDSIVSRFNGAENTISPRLPGKFESSYHDENNLVDETRSSLVSNEHTITGADHHDYTEHTANDGSIHLNNYNIHAEDGRETNDRSALNESRPRRSIHEMSENIQQQQCSQEESHVDRLANRLMLASQPPDKNKGDLYKVNRNQQTIEDSSEIGSLGAVFPTVSRLVEKETQRSEIQSVISPVVAAPPGRNNENIPDLNSQTSVRRDEAPVIKISIGRIEVRAVPATNASKSKDRAAQKPQLSLDEYLQMRNKGQ